MIYFNDKKWGKSLDALLNKKGFKSLSVHEKNKIDKILNKGGKVFFMINPYVSEMSCGEEGALNEFIWGENQEYLEEQFYQLKEEV